MKRSLFSIAVYDAKANVWIIFDPRIARQDNMVGRCEARIFWLSSFAYHAS